MEDKKEEVKEEQKEEKQESQKQEVNKEKKDTNIKLNEKSNEDIKLKFNKNKIIILSDVYRNSINFFQKNKKDEIGEIAECDELSIRPRTITVSKNIKIEQKVLEKRKK